MATFQSENLGRAIAGSGNKFRQHGIIRISGLNGLILVGAGGKATASSKGFRDGPGSSRSITSDRDGDDISGGATAPWESLRQDDDVIENPCENVAG